MVLRVNVFVYGSLMRGGHNHAALREADYLGLAQTAKAKFDLISFGLFPAMTVPGKFRVFGEAYRVTVDQLASLDRLEGTMYDRKEIEIKLAAGRDGPAWTYILRPENHGRIQSSCPRIGVRNTAKCWRL